MTSCYVQLNRRMYSSKLLSVSSDISNLNIYNGSIRGNLKDMVGSKKRSIHQSPIFWEQKSCSLPYQALWPQKQSQLMNQKKAGYQMSLLINTHIAFCNGIH